MALAPDDIAKLHGRNLTTNQKRALPEIRRNVLFTTFSPSNFEGPVTLSTSEEKAEFIRAKTKLFTETWTLPLIDILLGDEK